jgi:hypothetical protein
MSPRVIIKLECPYAECEEYTSTGRGTVTCTIVCQHPENEGCLCVLDPSVGGECTLYTEVEVAQESEAQESEAQEEKEEK